MWSSAREVAAGDTVIIWLTRDQVQPLVVTPGKDFNTKFGNFRQADFVGVPYGSKVPSRSGRGFIHILRPTPELWTIALPHRTQILYLADIAFITSYLNIRKGSRVIEAGKSIANVRLTYVQPIAWRWAIHFDSTTILTLKRRIKGTGSGSFSHSVTRTVGPSGHLYSYEFHEARFTKAKEEFTRHGMDDTVTVQHRNVCKDGFTVVDEVDAVFLDLPAPWEAVEHAKKALRKDRVTRICCFSPCIEQVLRTVNALNEAGFTEITMYETLLRPIEVFQVPQMQSVSVLSDKLKQSEQKREEKRLRQIAANKAAAAAAAAKPKRKRGEAEEDDRANVPESESSAEEGVSSKRVKTEDALSNGAGDPEIPQPIETDVEAGNEMDIVEESTIVEESNVPTTPLPSSSRASPVAPATSTSSASASIPKMNVAKALPEVRGHTSYLTFACLIPAPPSSSLSKSASGATSTPTVPPPSSDKPESEQPPEGVGSTDLTGKATS
ncbi:hypothetical protein CVT26_014526 [Gymnopilus dilepis]|uniref:tRNA (adenine(58)-N(1))-methyltransferase catalytic subunit TRM61 n=1 Tax=Gymnopilus dilepis TaxID=231916 RepID=A0A409W390_9AGAR|nr:hypothetical protein CVT26_014526 [Gymnopilus dilepis]